MSGVLYEGKCVTVTLHDGVALIEMTRAERLNSFIVITACRTISIAEEIDL
jgi:hypothetical protein